METPLPGDRPAARAEGGRQPRRHDAPGRRPDQAARGLQGAEIYGEAVVYERHRHRYEVNNLLRKRLEAAGLRTSGTSPDERLVEVIELDDHPFFVASQFHPEFKSRPERPAPLFRDFIAAALERASEAGDEREAGDDAADSAERSEIGGTQSVRTGSRRRAVTLGAVQSRVGALERRYLNGTFAELCRIESPSGRERACAERVIAELRALGVEVHEDDAGARAGSDCGNLLARIPAAAQGAGGGEAPAGAPCVLLCAHLDTVPLLAPVEPVLVDGYWENANEGVLGADNKAAVAVMLALARHICREGAPVDVELLFTVCEETALAGARAFDAGRLRSDFGYVFDHASPIGEVVLDSPTHFRIEADFRGAAAHAGIRPSRGAARSSPPRARSPRCASGAWTSETTVNVGTIAGGSAMNVVPERCSVVAEVRSLRRGARRGGRGRGRRSPARGGEPAGVRVRRGHRRAAHVLGLSPRGEQAGGARRRGRAEGLRPRARADRQRRGLRRQRAARRGRRGREPGQRHRAQPRAGRARQRGGARGDARRRARAARRGSRRLAGRRRARLQHRC